jgi:nitrogen regulatory protein PII
MKKIEAIIRDHRLVAVRNALSDSGVLHGMTVANINAATGPTVHV